MNKEKKSKKNWKTIYVPAKIWEKSNLVKLSLAKWSLLVFATNIYPSEIVFEKYVNRKLIFTMAQLILIENWFRIFVLCLDAKANPTTDLDKWQNLFQVVMMKSVSFSTDPEEPQVEPHDEICNSVWRKCEEIKNVQDTNGRIYKKDPNWKLNQSMQSNILYIVSASVLHLLRV